MVTMSAALIDLLVDVRVVVPLALVVGYLLLRERNKLPPGPRGVPLLGYVPFLTREPHKKLIEVGKTFGGVFSIRIGTSDTVILNDWAAIKEAFSKDCFSARPEKSIFQIFDPLVSFGTESGEIWREQKRFAMKTLRDLGFGRNKMEEHIKEEITHFLMEIKKVDSDPIEIRSFLSPSVSNVICALVFGHRYDYNHPTRVMLDNTLDPKKKNMLLFGLMMLFPEYRLLFRTIAFLGILGVKNMRQQSMEMKSYVESQVKDHLETLDANNIRDYMDGFLVEMQQQVKTNPNTTFSVDMLVGNVRGFFSAGSDTVRTTLEWLFLTLAAYPEVQQKMQKELDTVVGRDRSPEWADRLLMTYTQSVLLEIQRWKSIVPLDLPRRNTQDVKIQGVFIPRDSQILANFWAVHYDPELWENPEVFDPTRFLSEDEKVVKHEAFIPFSYGKRSCPGESLANVEMFLYTTHILQKYMVRIPSGEEADFSESLGITLQPKKPAVLSFVSRNSGEK